MFLEEDQKPALIMMGAGSTLSSEFVEITSLGSTMLRIGIGLDKITLKEKPGERLHCAHQVIME